jgi:hypothetical protein
LYFLCDGISWWVSQINDDASERKKNRKAGCFIDVVVHYMY